MHYQAPNFVYFHLTGAQATAFLQGQICANVHKIGDAFIASAICNLKGRIHFGLWLKQYDDGFIIVLSDDLKQDFMQHIKKYGAFSKIFLSEPAPIGAVVQNGVPTFKIDAPNDTDWAVKSIETGNFWINQTNSEKFQPQQLRLHQRGGVDYDKGCYLGQEVVARLYFKSSPKSFLQRVCLADVADNAKFEVVNVAPYKKDLQALVVATKDALDSTLCLPDALLAPVGRQA